MLKASKNYKAVATIIAETMFGEGYSNANFSWQGSTLHALDINYHRIWSPTIPQNLDKYFLD